MGKHSSAIPEPGQTWSDVAQSRGQRIRQALGGNPVATGDPNSPWSPGGATQLVTQPQSPTLLNRLWWGSGSVASGSVAGEQGYNLLSSTLLLQDDGRHFMFTSRTDPAIQASL